MVRTREVIKEREIVIRLTDTGKKEERKGGGDPD